MMMIGSPTLDLIKRHSAPYLKGLMHTIRLLYTIPKQGEAHHASQGRGGGEAGTHTTDHGFAESGLGGIIYTLIYATPGVGSLSVSSLLPF